ncbi:MAG: ABC transporter substrate-binding protein [Candidatus Pacebacteria bacterium]|nr:ABC transporter substrate-binding protein [Candidatus Paceibacterota bacterium]
MPSFKQWLQFLKVLNFKEKMLFFSLLAVFVFSLSFVFSGFLQKNTVIVPSEGGEAKEGVLGQPQFINPLYAYSSEVDREITELVFSSLFTYDSQGNIVPDLIEDYRITDSGKSIEFSIRENAKWHDNQPLTVDDVIFTLNLVQDPNYLSPLRANFQGVETEKMSDFKALIRLKQAYAGFFESLTNLKILPKHVWQNIPASQIMANTELNLLSPVGSGPYVVKNVEQSKDKTIKSISLEINKKYYGEKPHLKKFEFVFFNKKEDLVNALKKGAVDLGLLETAGEYDLSQFKSSNVYLVKTPNYFSLFYNNAKKPLDNEETRKALDMALNKEEVLDKAVAKNGEIVSSPILPSFYGFNEPENPAVYNQEEAKNILQGQGFEEKDGIMVKTIKKTSGFEFKQVLQAGSNNAEVGKLQECLAQDPEIYQGEISGYFGKQTKAAVILFQEKYKEDVLAPSGLEKGTGKVGAATIKKLNEVCFTVPDEELTLGFTIKTTGSPSLLKAAQDIKEQWEKIGVKVEIKELDTLEIKKTIRDRDFDILLFGEKLGGIPDPLPFWHSSQIIDPGLNISMYENEEADGLLTKARTYSDFQSEDRKKALEDFQNILIENCPATFLYSSYSAYVINKDIKGVELDKISDLSKRFVDIKNWYINQKRIWKKT